MHNRFEVTSDSEFGISLYDIVQFIQDNWKRLLAAGIFGAILGFSGWFFLGTYEAKLILLNKSNTNTNGLDLVTWRIVQKSLPSLASQILANQNLPSDAKFVYRQMSDATWWSKGVVPIYAISRADMKDFAGTSKGLEAASNTISFINIYMDGDSNDSAINNARLVAKFIKSGSAYLQIKSLLNDYQAETTGMVADIQNQITVTEIELTFLRDRAKALEALQKRFPSNVGFNLQLFDFKEADVKYLPLPIQIIAVNNEIYQNTERLIRFNDRLKQIDLIKQFLDDALPVTKTELDGFLLSKSLLAVEDKLRKGLSPADIKNREALDKLRSQLLIIESRFANGLEVNNATASEKIGMLKASVLGLIVAEFLMLVFLLGRRLFNYVSKDGVSLLS